MLHEGLVAQLLADTVTAAFLVGDDSEHNRVYPLVMPQKIPRGPSQTPCVVYQTRSVDRQVTYCGTSGLIRTMLQLDCYSSTYTEAKQLADAVRTSLIDFRGSLGGVVSVRHAALESEFDLQDPEPGLYRVSQNWVFWHEED